MQAYDFVSNNHFMLGHLMEWLYSGSGSIRQQENSIAFHEILIDPQIVGDVAVVGTEPARIWVEAGSRTYQFNVELIIKQK